MKEFIDKLIKRLEEYCKPDCSGCCSHCHFSSALEIVNQLAEECQAGLKDYVEGQEIESYGRPRVYMSIEELNELKAYRDFGTLSQMRFLNEWYHEFREEHNGGWIPCSERLPEEHDSIFAEFKGTDKWKSAMFEKISDAVNVTVVGERGDAVTMQAHTVDGEWNCDLLKVNKSYRVIAWQPLPAPYKPKG